MNRQAKTMELLSAHFGILQPLLLSFLENCFVTRCSFSLLWTWTIWSHSIKIYSFTFWLDSSSAKINFINFVMKFVLLANKVQINTFLAIAMYNEHDKWSHRKISSFSHAEIWLIWCTIDRGSGGRRYHQSVNYNNKISIRRGAE